MKSSNLHKSETKPSQSTGDDEESCVEEIFLQVGAGKKVQDDDRMKPPSPNQNFLNCIKQGLSATKMERSSPEFESRSSSSAKLEQLDDQLGSTKAEMEEVMEENQRLKMYLDRILKDYRTLQTQYRDVIQQEAKKSPQKDEELMPDDQIIDLSLGMSSSTNRIIKGEARKSPKNNAIEEAGDHKQELGLGFDLTKMPLARNSPNDSPENSVEETKAAVKNVHGRDGGDQDEAQQNPAKRARVSVRVRCDTPTMNDGCQWRKYGQKIAKGNPCPRAYYRCTVAPSCPVRKQVQRCAEDMSILITTYEGTHSHPLPISATAMASTTSAAASMLLSGSSTSGATPGSSTGTLNGLNFYLSDNSRPKPFYLPNSSISSSPSFPTITLDLTSSSSSHLNRLGSFPPRNSSTNLNFSSLESNPPPISWNNGMLSYGSSQPSINKNQTTNSLTFGSQLPYETLYQSYFQKTISNPSQHSLPSDTLAAATKAITSDPSFQSALAAALSSIINGPSSTAPSNPNADEKSSNSFPILSSFPSSSNANKCAPSFMNTSSSLTSTQPAGLMRLSPPFPFSNSKSKSNSPSDNMDHTT